MSSRRKKHLITLTTCLSVLALVTLACGPLAEAINQQPQQPIGPIVEVPDSFTSTMEGEDGLFVELRGNSRGYLPGGEATFVLQVHNGSEENWQTSFCLQLLDSERIISTMLQDNFTLQPQEGFETLMTIRFPQDLPQNAYGLALAFPERFSMVNTIYVGQTVREPAGPWIQPACPE